jgi:hypothetical protein
MVVIRHGAILSGCSLIGQWGFLGGYESRN